MQSRTGGWEEEPWPPESGVQTETRWAQPRCSAGGHMAPTQTQSQDHSQHPDLHTAHSAHSQTCVPLCLAQEGTRGWRGRAPEMIPAPRKMCMMEARGQVGGREGRQDCWLSRPPCPQSTHVVTGHL